MLRWGQRNKLVAVSQQLAP